MVISDKKIKELVVLYEKHTGERISEADAKEMGEKLINYVRLICLPNDEEINEESEKCLCAMKLK